MYDSMCMTVCACETCVSEERRREFETEWYREDQ